MPSARNAAMTAAPAFMAQSPSTSAILLLHNGAAMTTLTLTLEHTLLNEADALKLLAGQRIARGGRTMDPKAQIVGEFVKSISKPGYFQPLPELRQQLRTMVTLMDEPAPALARIEDITIPGPAGPIPARVYDATGAGGPARVASRTSTAAAGCMAISRRITASARGSRSGRDASRD